MDKFLSLQLFVASAEHGSFSRAAEQRDMTPSAVAKSIRRLEAEVGARLFERTTRSMALTEAGLLYLENARDILERMRETEEEIAQLQHTLKGTLRVTGPLSFGRPFLNAACARFLQAHPQMSLQVDLSDQYIDLLDGHYDMALRLGQSDLPGLIAQPIGESRVVLCASPGYLHRHGTPTLPAQLATHECLVYRHPALGDSWVLEKDGERHAIKRKGRLGSDNLELLIEACLAGQGVIACPYWSVLPYLQAGRLQAFLGDYAFDRKALGAQLQAVYPSTRRATRKIAAFIEHLRTYLSEEGMSAVAGQGGGG
ncbi:MULTISPECIES: LysR family transcriptional regulator [Pseudomonas]|uniref:HTH-type transcriptional regulator DmlR n=1 Tax=Pseudomonas putida TaxID=303 RepID=A0A1B2F3H9_PSEPU|nr:MULTISPECIES: LysR family transcriptional regulator [Pseudomonas]ANY86812.1 HTH-type transcriptional regulator DmlR [Pseudomonas putida]MCL8305244.1 LysR family transcriptional regulator [Pseudomonas putida]